MNYSLILKILSMVFAIMALAFSLSAGVSVYYYSGSPLEGEALARCEEELALIFKAKLGCTPEAKGVPMGELPRSEKKTKRIFDSRY